jgi:hypothetical protein
MGTESSVTCSSLSIGTNSLSGRDANPTSGWGVLLVICAVTQQGTRTDIFIESFVEKNVLCAYQRGYCRLNLF